MTIADFQIDGKSPNSKILFIRSKRVCSVDSERCLRTWNGYYRDHMQYHVIFWLRITFTFTTNKHRGCRGRDLMVFGFATTYTVSVYHHWCCEFESPSERGIQHYVIKFVSDLLQVGGFLRSSVSSTNKTDRNDMTNILLKVALIPIK
jgi:hypothetical protein